MHCYQEVDCALLFPHRDAAVKSSSPDANTLASSGLPAMTPATALLEVTTSARSGLEASAWGPEGGGREKL